MLAHNFNTISIWIIYKRHIPNDIDKPLIQPHRRIPQEPINLERNLLPLILQNLRTRIFQSLLRSVMIRTIIPICENPFDAIFLVVNSGPSHPRQPPPSRAQTDRDLVP